MLSGVSPEGRLLRLLVFWRGTNNSSRQRLPRLVILGEHFLVLLLLLSGLRLPLQRTVDHGPGEVLLLLAEDVHGGVYGRARLLLHLHEALLLGRVRCLPSQPDAGRRLLWNDVLWRQPGSRWVGPCTGDHGDGEQLMG